MALHKENSMNRAWGIWDYIGCTLALALIGSIWLGLYELAQHI